MKQHPTKSPVGLYADAGVPPDYYTNVQKRSYGMKIIMKYVIIDKNDTYHY